MNKSLFVLKTISITTGILSLFMFILHEFNVIQHDLIVFDALLLSVFIASLYLFFVIADIKKNKFFYLGGLNYLIFLFLVVTFFYWGIINTNGWGLVYSAYMAIFVFLNLVVMSIVFFLRKTGTNFFYRQWLIFLGIVLLYIALAFVNRMTGRFHSEYSQDAINTQVENQQE